MNSPSCHYHIPGLCSTFSDIWVNDCFTSFYILMVLTQTEQSCFPDGESFSRTNSWSVIDWFSLDQEDLDSLLVWFFYPIWHSLESLSGSNSVQSLWILKDWTHAVFYKKVNTGNSYSKCYDLPHWDALLVFYSFFIRVSFATMDSAV